MTGAPRLRRWREERNLTQEQFAAVIRACGEDMGVPLACSPQLVGKWERGEIEWPSHAYRKCLHRATGMSCEELGFHAPWSFEDAKEYTADQPPRIFGSQPWPAQPRPGPLQNYVPAFAFGPLCRAVTKSDLAAVRAMAVAATTADRHYGGECMREVTSAYLTEFIRPLLHSERGEESTRQAFLVAAAEVAVRAAWMNLDVGNALASRNYMTLAFTWAQESRDSAAMALVLAMRTLESIWLKNPKQAEVAGRAAVRLSQTGKSATLRAFCLGMYARGLSVSGKSDAAHEAMEASQNQLTSESVDTDIICLEAYGLSHALDDEANCYHALGMSAEALDRSRESLRLRGDNPPARRHALTKVNIVQALIDLKQIDLACAETYELASLAAQISSKRVCDGLGLAVTALRPFRKSPVVLDLEESVRALLAGTAAQKWLALALRPFSRAS